MATVAHITEDIIKRRPFLLDALEKGIINHAALAESLKPEIESQLNKEVKFSAINMAIRRISLKLEKENVPFGQLYRSEIMIRTGLTEFSLIRNPDTIKFSKQLYQELKDDPTHFFAITQGMSEIVVIVSKHYLKKALEVFDEKSIKRTYENICSLTITMTEDTKDIVGVFYQITKALAWENISILEIISTYAELSILIRNEDSATAFAAITRLINEKKTS